MSLSDLTASLQLRFWESLPPGVATALSEAITLPGQGPSTPMHPEIEGLHMPYYLSGGQTPRDSWALIAPETFLITPASLQAQVESEGVVATVSTFGVSFFRSVVTLFVIVNCVWPAVYLTFAVIAGRKARLTIADRVQNHTGTQQFLVVLAIAVAASGAPLFLRQCFHNIFAPFYNKWMFSQPLGVICFFVSPSFHIALYFALMVPALVLQLAPEGCFSVDKIQGEKPPADLNDYVQVTKMILYSMTVLQLPFICFQGWVCMNTGVMLPYESLSSLEWYVCVALPVSMLLGDAWHYMAHRTCHEFPRLYKWAHKLHHSYPNPFAPMAEYASMTEQLFLGIEFFLGLSLFTDQILFLYVWLVWRLVLTTDDHFGYDVSVFLTRWWMPFFTGTRHHDFHHKFFNGNYAPTFIWWDRWLGTDVDYAKFESKEMTIEAESNCRRAEEAQFGKGNVIEELVCEASAKGGKNAKKGGKELVRANMSEEEILQEQRSYAEGVAGGNWSYAGLTVAITGSEGMVGGAIKKLLVERGCRKLVCIDVCGEKTGESEKTAAPSLLEKLGLSRQTTLEVENHLSLDITCPETAVSRMSKIFKESRVDVVIHLAALVGPYHAHEAYEKVNLNGTKNVTIAAEQAGVRGLVECSTPCSRLLGVDVDGLTEAGLDAQRGVGKEFLHEYARTKYLAEKWVLGRDNKQGLRTCAVLPHQVYGPDDLLFLPNFLSAAKSGRLRPLGDRNIMISFSHCENIGHGLLLAGKGLLNRKENAGGRVFAVTDGVNSPFWDRMHFAIESNNLPSIRRKLHCPRSVLMAVAWMNEKIVSPLLGIQHPKLTTFSMRLMTMNRYLCIATAKHHLGYVPLVDPEVGWKRTCEAVGKRMFG